MIRCLIDRRAVQGLIGWVKQAYPLWIITLAVWLPIWFYNTHL